MNGVLECWSVGVLGCLRSALALSFPSLHYTPRLHFSITPLPDNSNAPSLRPPCHAF